MFSFHKPRVYRSSEGCCICRAKTSSSRFIESKKYERDAMKCFLLEEPRKGEICNACVLLVKRFKRLPVGSNKNWGHVVDARGGTSTKSQKNINNATAKVANTQNGNGSNSTSRSLLPEKFAKIFKKNKKVKNSKKCELNGSKRKIINNNFDINGSCLPTTPDSVDSDCDDGHYTAPTNLQTGTYVEFQTETRASSYRTRKNSTFSSVKTENFGGSNGRRRSLQKLGSKRRKCFIPQKRLNALDSEEKMEFFDANEWKKRKTCCGVVYECLVLSNALLINQEDYHPCDEHKFKLKNSIAVQKPIATLPAVVQLQATTKPTNSSINTMTPSCTNIVTNIKSSTPVLKKHHLFFKRQSESFPHSDINNSNNNTSNSSTFHTKTETIAQNSNMISTITPPITTAAVTASSISCNKSTSISSSATPYVNNINNILMSSTLSLANTTTSNTVTTTPFNYMPKHSSAKVTTISTPLTASVSTKSQHFLHKIKSDTGKIVKHSMEKINTAVRIKPIDMQDMKHVIKTVEKSYVLAKPTTITPINCASNTVNGSSSQLLQYPHGLPHTLTATTIAAGASSPSALSSSSTSSTSTKFSDNSSDSGFDENMLDRKSASPLQEDTERKIITRSGVQTMFLSSGVQIQGQHQNLVLTGNEVAAKLIQNRRTATNTSTITVQPVTVSASSTATVPATTMHHHQQYTNNNRATSATTSTVKITQIIGGVNGNLTSGSHVAKMRAIYNNNTIQHENGVTTIVPASSLAATTQTAAMNAIAPSTVTITPAPIQATTNNNNNLNGKKVLTSSNIISLTGGTTNSSIINKGNNNNDYQNAQSFVTTNNNATTTTAEASATATHLNVYNQQQHQHKLHHHQQQLQQPQQQNHHHYQHHQQNQQNTNQKIILLKTTPNMARSTTTKYNTSNTTQNINKTTMPQNLNALQTTANIIKTRP